MDFSSELPPLESAGNRSPTVLVERFPRKEVSGDLLGSCKEMTGARAKPPKKAARCLGVGYFQIELSKLAGWLILLH